MDQLDQPITVLSWNAPSQPAFKRSAQWYAIGGVIVLVLAGYGIMTGSWPFAIVMVLLGAMYYILRDHVPPQKSIALTNKGVQLGETFTRWEDIEGFWLLETPDYTELHVVHRDKKKFDLIIQTGTQNVQAIRTALGQLSTELTDRQERFVDMLIRICKL